MSDELINLLEQFGYGEEFINKLSESKLQTIFTKQVLWQACGVSSIEDFLKKSNFSVHNLKDFEKISPAKRDSYITTQTNGMFETWEELRYYALASWLGFV